MVVSSDLTTCVPAVERPTRYLPTASCGEASVAAVPCCERIVKMSLADESSSRMKSDVASVLP
jgi:hypothetical protein